MFTHIFKFYIENVDDKNNMLPLYNKVVMDSESVRMDGIWLIEWVN